MWEEGWQQVLARAEEEEEAVEIEMVRQEVGGTLWKGDEWGS